MDEKQDKLRDLIFHNTMEYLDNEHKVKLLQNIFDESEDYVRVKFFNTIKQPIRKDNVCIHHYRCSTRKHNHLCSKGKKCFE